MAMAPADDPASGFYAAARVFAERLGQAHPEPAEAFLRRHETLREWLEPMLAEESPEAGDDATRVHETIGTRLGPYRLLREIGRGGMGVVHEARREGESRSFALKLLPEHLALRDGTSARFAREIELAQRLDHPGIVRVRDSGTAASTRFLVMDFVAGAPLDRVLAALRGRDPAGLTGADLAAAIRTTRHRQEAETDAPGTGTLESGAPETDGEAFAGGYVACVVRIAIQVAHALAHAHTAGVIHRDVKPSNLLVRTDGSVVLTDLGLARDAQVSTLTVTGDFAGTPHYVSPEQAMAKRVPVDQRTDLFSLGSTLYELLTLRRPFEGETTQEVLGRILTKEPPPPGRFHAGLPEDLVTILLKLLEKDPDRRYLDATQLASDLRAFLEYRPVAARRASNLYRALRWTRREPVKATLAGVLAVALPVIAAGGGYVWAKRDEIRAGQDQLRTRQVDQRIEQGFQSYMLENPDLGVPDFEAALALEPRRLEAQFGLVVALQKRDGADAALARLERDLAPAMAPAARDLLRSSLLLRAGRTEQALEIYRRLPPPTTAFELLEHGFLNRDRGPSAGSQLLEYTERAVLADDRPHLWVHIHWAVFAGEARDASSARRCAANLLLNWPRSPIARYFACVALRHVEPERAAALVREALAEQPDVAILHCAQGMVLRVQDQRPAAIAAFERAVKLAPGIPTFHYNLGHACYEAGDTARAVAEFRAALALTPRMVDAWIALGMAQRKVGEHDDALVSLRKAVALHPTSADARFQLGQLLVQLEQVPEGLVELREAARLNAKDPNKWHHVAGACFTNGDESGGLQALRTAVTASPAYERGHELLATYLRGRGDHAELRAALEAWVAALPGSARAWTWLGWHQLDPEVPEELHDPVGAAWAGRRALALTREQSASAWCLLGEAQAWLKQGDAARVALERGLALTPSDLADAQRGDLRRRLRELHAETRPASLPGR